MSTRCVECGAVGCSEAFDRAMALEMTDPEFGAVHHLTVPAYMIQHPSRLSAYGWQAELALLGEFLDGMSPEEVRRRAMSEGPSLQKGEPIDLAGMSWSRTIADVRFATAELYRLDVWEWAEVVAVEAPDHPGGQGR